MKVDSFFVQGKSHDICQDYALHKEGKLSTFGIISDGCSMIALPDGTAIKHPLSDVAARLVCLCAESLLLDIEKDDGYKEASEIFPSTLFTYMNIISRAFGNSLLGDATLSVIHHKKIIVELCIGDGILVIERKNLVEVRVRKMEPNYPLCISHIMNQNRRKLYENNINRKIETIYFYNKATGEHEEEEVTLPLSRVAMMDINVINSNDLVSVSVFSDGLSDMVYPDGSHVHVVDAALEMLDIKNSGGNFVRRRMKGMMRKSKNNIGPNDDLSMAMIRM